MDDALERKLVLAELENQALRIRLKVVRDTLQKVIRASQRSRVPVVLEVMPSGDVTLYAENGTVDLETVLWPNVEWNAVVEEWLGWQLGERHRALYVPSCVESRVNGANCKRTLAQAYEAYERMLDELPVVKALVAQSKKEREFYTPKGKANAQTKTNHRRHGAVKRGA